jgi:hypothetical protein
MANLLSTSVTGTVNSTGNMTAAGFTGNANVGGTGAATWHPSGIYVGSTQWLYGTMYKNGSGIYDVGEITTSSHGTSANWKSAYDWGNHASAGYLTSVTNISGNAGTTSQRDFSGDISTGGMGRFTGWYNGNAQTGLAAEIGISGGQAYIIAYNRQSGAYGTLNLESTSANLRISGSTINATSGTLQQGGNAVIHAGNIGSQSVTYATSAGSAPNAGNANDFYNVNAGNGNGLRFWNSDNYKISMGVGDLYQYGPVTEYSIKTQMNDGDTGRGFTWGRLSHAPIAALNSTSGDMQIRGTFAASNFSGSSSGTNTGDQTNISGNAATAGGLAVHGGTNNEANKIVRTDVNGYINAGWINSISGNMGFENRIARITCSTDQYMRFQTLSEFKVSLGMSGKNDYSRRIDYSTDADYHVGSFGHGGSEVGNIDRIFHYGSGFFDVWSGNGTYAPGTSHIHGFNALHYTTGYGGNAYGWQMASQYNQTGLIYARWCSGGSFSAWQTIITSTNIGSQSVSYASTAGNTNSISSAVGGTYYWTGLNYFQSNLGATSGALANAPLQAYCTGGNSAFMSFHRSGNYAVNFGLDSDNVLRMGGWSATANRWQLDMSGNMTVAGDVTAFSDARVKTNVKTIENALDKTLALRGVSYNRTDSDDTRTKIGVIAQETLEVVPEVVNQDNSGMYNVSYGNMTALLIEAIKEQQAQIEDLKSEVKKLRGE